jgi:predicted glycosyltransferase
VPRLEQRIRAARAAELGLVAMLAEEDGADPKVMAAALRRLAWQRRPSAAVMPGLLDGMENVNRLAGRWLGRGRVGRLAAGVRVGV